MQLYSVEKTVRDNGEQSVVLVDRDLNIVEEVALFLHYLEKKGRSLNTVESYCRDLKEYYTWLSKEELKFYEVNKRSMISWIDFINSEVGKKRDKSGRTVNRYLASVTSFYRYYEGVGGYIEENPLTIKNRAKSNIYFFEHKVHSKNFEMNFFRQKEMKSKNTRRLFRNQVELLYKGLETITDNADLIVRNKLLFRFLYETGCRIGETLGLRIMDYSEPDPTKQIGCIYVRRHLPYYHKDHFIKTNERDIPVSMDLIFAIDDYVCTVRPQKDTIETIFVNHGTSNNGKYMTRNQVSNLFQELSEKVNIKCTPHMLRHTHGTELSESGYSEMYIMDRLGHNSILTTEKYVHISYEAQSKAYESFMQQRNGMILK